MKSEFWAEFDLYGEAKKKDLIRYFIGTKSQTLSRNGGLLSWELITDLNMRQQLLAQLLASEDECGRTKCKDYAKGKNGLQQWYYGGDIQNPKGDFQEFICRRARWMASILGLVNQEVTVAPSLPDLSIFPPGSWAVQITFTLRKPYISKDDVDFYILDNPVKKEHVFKVPYVAPSQWKGTLRAAMVRELVEWWRTQDTKYPMKFARRRFHLALLFGDEKGEESGSIKGLAKYLDEIGGDEAARLFREKMRKYFGVHEDKPMPHFQGRLHFYPTFFDKIGLEVINPHDRKTGTGKQPIYFECVPTGTKGTFTLLYVPSYLSDKPEEAQNQAKRDLKTVLRGLYAMFKRYGFGAKTSSGYGVVKDATCKVLKN